jgi:hypothetical protein
MISFAHRYAQGCRHEAVGATRVYRLVVVPRIPLRSYQPDYDETKAVQLTNAAEEHARRDNIAWQFEGDERRRQSESQRRAIAARLEQLKQGRPGKDANVHVSRGSAAELLNVSPSTAANAREVADDRTSELAAVDSPKPRRRFFLGAHHVFRSS